MNAVLDGLADRMRRLSGRYVGRWEHRWSYPAIHEAQIYSRPGEIRLRPAEESEGVLVGEAVIEHPLGSYDVECFTRSMEENDFGLLLDTHPQLFAGPLRRCGTVEGFTGGPDLDGSCDGRHLKGEAKLSYDVRLTEEHDLAEVGFQLSFTGRKPVREDGERA